MDNETAIEMIKAMVRGRDAEAGAQSAYYTRQPGTGGTGIDEEVTDKEEKKLKKIEKELKKASKLHKGQSQALAKASKKHKDQADRIAKLVKEKLTKKHDVGDFVDDFKKSKAKQFRGKSAKKKKEMAVAAYLAKQND